MNTHELIKRLKQDITPIGKANSGYHFALSLLGTAALVTIVLILKLHVRSDLALVANSPQHRLEALLLLTIILLGGIQAYRSSVPGVIRTHTSTVTSLLLIALVYLISISLHRTDDASLMSHPWSGASCTLMITCHAGLGLALGMRLLKRGVCLRHQFSAFYLAAACIASGLLVQSLLCYKDDALHLFVWHFCAYCLGLITGTALGGRWLRWLA